MASSSKLWSVKDEIFTLDTKLQVREFLGSGAYGVVCSAWNSESDEMVAIKKCKKILASKTMAKRMLAYYWYRYYGVNTCRHRLRELRILRFLEHSNVVKILGIQRLANRETFEELYVVLEYMETDLAQIIRSSQTLREEHVQYFTYQMLLALEYIHGCRVMHRDIKPRNILVNRYRTYCASSLAC
jgi:mitogen-activated protein kinase 1/3